MGKKRIRRNQKDTVFCALFKKKKELLQLYNAVNGTAYTNPEDLEITTLENAVYMSMKNDVSCCLDMNLQLYEQQSTVNPNMPVRFLEYITEQMGKLMVHRKIYSRRAVPLPTPKFFVFYNGTDSQPQTRIMRLSEHYTHKEESPSLELVVTQLNINPGYNEELKQKCPVLMEYMEYVTCIRKYRESLPLEEAVPLAVDECIKSGILKEFLSENKAMVVKMSIYEFDEEQYRKDMYEEAYEDGERDGYAKGENAGYAKGENVGYAKGKNAGYTEGKHRERLAIAARMKAQGMPGELIRELTGVSEKDITDPVFHRN